MLRYKYDFGIRSTFCIMDFLLCLVLTILSDIIIYKETITFLEQCGIKTKTWVKYLGTPTIVKMGDSFGNLCAI